MLSYSFLAGLTPLLAEATPRWLQTAADAAVPAALLGAAIYLLLPQPRSYPRFIGALVAALALLAGAVLLLWGAVSIEFVCFYVFSTIAIVAGILLVTQRNPARAALSFALVVISTCGLFLLLAAPFLTAATVIIYAGAIVVTFLFVLMLAQQEGVPNADYRSREPLLSAVAGALLLGTLLYALQLTYRTSDFEEIQQQTQALRQEVAALPQDAPTPQEVRQRAQGVLNGYDKWAREHEQLLPRSSRDMLEDAQETVRRPISPADLDRLLVHCLQVPETLGQLQPPPRVGRMQPYVDVRLSDFSGPLPNLPLAEQRRDEQGRPELPAQNVGYLGRSLFTDFLLAVELGGTLLLVATIGAIAIASRRATGPAMPAGLGPPRSTADVPVQRRPS